MAVDILFLQNVASTTDASSYTFTAQNIGTAATDRLILVAFQARRSGGSTTITGVTIGGITATIVKQQTTTSANTTVVGLAIAAVPTGTTGDIVVTYANGMLRCAAQAYRLVGADITAFATASSGVNPSAASLAIPANGGAVGCVAFANTTGTATWAGLTVRSNTITESAIICTSASDVFVSADPGLAVSCTYSASVTDPAGVFASFSPAAGTTILPLVLNHRRRMMEGS